MAEHAIAVIGHGMDAKSCLWWEKTGELRDETKSARGTVTSHGLISAGQLHTSAPRSGRWEINVETKEATNLTCQRRKTASGGDDVGTGCLPRWHGRARLRWPRPKFNGAMKLLKASQHCKFHCMRTKNSNSVLGSVVNFGIGGLGCKVAM